MNGKLKKNFAKNDQTHPSLNLYCFHIVSATDFIQTLNKTEDFKLLILDSGVFATFYSFWDITVLVQCFFCPSSDNGCVLRIVYRPERMMSSPQWRSSEM